eukprot:m.270357 g.270357  ORF g.270357 m.270357 type:complete len:3213 (-) comp16263_c0_seq1:100-9738(-)
MKAFALLCAVAFSSCFLTEAIERNLVVLSQSKLVQDFSCKTEFTAQVQQDLEALFKQHVVDVTGLDDDAEDHDVFTARCATESSEGGMSRGSRKQQLNAAISVEAILVMDDTPTANRVLSRFVNSQDFIVSPSPERNWLHYEQRFRMPKGVALNTSHTAFHDTLNRIHEGSVSATLRARRDVQAVPAAEELCYNGNRADGQAWASHDATCQCFGTCLGLDEETSTTSTFTSTMAVRNMKCGDPMAVEGSLVDTVCKKVKARDDDDFRQFVMTENAQDAAVEFGMPKHLGGALEEIMNDEEILDLVKTVSFVHFQDNRGHARLGKLVFDLKSRDSYWSLWGKMYGVSLDAIMETFLKKDSNSTEKSQVEMLMDLVQPALEGALESVEEALDPIITVLKAVKGYISEILTPEGSLFVMTVMWSLEDERYVPGACTYDFSPLTPRFLVLANLFGHDAAACDSDASRRLRARRAATTLINATNLNNGEVCHNDTNCDSGFCNTSGEAFNVTIEGCIPEEAIVCDPCTPVAAVVCEVNDTSCTPVTAVECPCVDQDAKTCTELVTGGICEGTGKVNMVIIGNGDPCTTDNNCAGTGICHSNVCIHPGCSDCFYEHLDAAGNPACTACDNHLYDGLPHFDFKFHATDTTNSHSITKSSVCLAFRCPRNETEVFDFVSSFQDSMSRLKCPGPVDEYTVGSNQGTWDDIMALFTTGAASTQERAISTRELSAIQIAIQEILAPHKVGSGDTTFHLQYEMFSTLKLKWVPEGSLKNKWYTHLVPEIIITFNPMEGFGLGKINNVGTTVERTARTPALDYDEMPPTYEGFVLNNNEHAFGKVGTLLAPMYRFLGLFTYKPQIDVAFKWDWGNLVPDNFMGDWMDLDGDFTMQFRNILSKKKAITCATFCDWMFHHYSFGFAFPEDGFLEYRKQDIFHSLFGAILDRRVHPLVKSDSQHWSPSNFVTRWLYGNLFHREMWIRQRTAMKEWLKSSTDLEKMRACVLYNMKAQNHVWHNKNNHMATKVLNNPTERNKPCAVFPYRRRLLCNVHQTQSACSADPSGACVWAPVSTATAKDMFKNGFHPGLIFVLLKRGIFGSYMKKFQCDASPNLHRVCEGPYKFMVKDNNPNNYVPHLRKPLSKPYKSDLLPDLDFTQSRPLQRLFRHSEPKGTFLQSLIPDLRMEAHLKVYFESKAKSKAVCGLRANFPVGLSLARFQHRDTSGKFYEPFNTVNKGKPTGYSAMEFRKFAYSECTKPTSNAHPVMASEVWPAGEPDTLWPIVLNEIYKMYGDQNTPPYRQYEVHQQILGQVDNLIRESSVTRPELLNMGENLGAMQTWQEALYNVRTSTPMIRPKTSSRYVVVLSLPDMEVKQFICLGFGVNPGFGLVAAQNAAPSAECNQWALDFFNSAGKGFPLYSLLSMLFNIGIRSASVSMELSGAGCKLASAGSSTAAQCESQSSKAKCLALAGCKWNKLSTSLKEGIKCGKSAYFLITLPNFLINSVEIPVRIKFSSKSCAINAGGAARRRDRRADGLIHDETGQFYDNMTAGLPEDGELRVALERGRRAGGSGLPFTFALELTDLQTTFEMIFGVGNVPSFLEDVSKAVQAFLPASLKAALVISPYQLIGTSGLPDSPALKELPPTFVVQAGASFIAVLSVKDGCEKDDFICNFIYDLFGPNAVMFLNLGIGFEPSVNAAIGLGGVTMIKYPGCNLESGASKLRLEELSVYMQASLSPVPSFVIGLSLIISVEFGKLPTGVDGETECTNQMVNPMVIGGRLELNPILGMVYGEVTLRNVFQIPGVSFVHIGHLGGGIGIMPGPVIPRVALSGMFAIGEECYMKNEDGRLVEWSADPEEKLPADYQPACVQAELAFGYDAANSRNNYIMAMIKGFNVETMMRVFAPRAVREKLDAALPQIVKDTGFEGNASFSFSFNPAGAITITGRRVPGGLRVHGRLNILGYKSMADIIVDPYGFKVFAHVQMDRLSFGGSLFTIAGAGPDGCVAEVAPVQQDLYDEQHAECQAMTTEELCVGNTSTLPPGQCRWAAPNRGPLLFINATLGLAPQEILAGNPLNVFQPRIDVLTSVKLSVLGTTTEALWRITNTDMIIEGSIKNMMRIPGLSGYVLIAARYGSLKTAGFRVKGAVALDNIITSIAEIFSDVVGLGADALNLIGGENGPVSQLIGFFSTLDKKLEAVEDDIPLGACLADIVKGAISAANTILGPLLELAKVDTIAELGEKIGGYITMVANMLTSLKNAIDTADLSAFDDFLRLNISFDFTSNPGETSVEFAGYAMLFGLDTSFTLLLDAGMSLQEVVKFIGEKIVEGTLHVIDFIISIKDKVVEVIDEIKKVDVGKEIGKFIKTTWNGVKVVADGALDAADTVLTEASGATDIAVTTVSGLQSGVNWCSKWVGEINKINNVPGLQSHINKVKKVASDFKDELNGFSGQLGTAKDAISTFKGQMQTCVDTLGFPGLKGADIDVTGGKVFLILEMDNDKTLRISLTARRNARYSRASCGGQIEELFELVVKELAPVYVTVRDFFEEQVNKIMGPIQPVINTVKTVIDMFASGTVRIENPVDIGGAGLVVLKDPQDSSKGPVLKLPVGDSGVFAFSGQVTWFGAVKQSLIVQVSSTQLDLTSSTKIFNLFQTSLNVNFVYTKQFAITGTINMGLGAKEAKAIAAAAVGAVKTATNAVFGNGKPLTVMIQTLGNLQGQINTLKKVPFGDCIAYLADGALAAVNGIIKTVTSGCKGCGVTDLSSLSTFLLDKVKQFTTWINELSSPNVNSGISLTATTRVTAGNTNSISVSVTAKIVGITKTFTLTLSTGMTMKQVGKAISDKAIALVMPIVNVVKSAVDTIKREVTNFVNKAKFSCTGTCSANVAHAYNAATSVAAGAANGLRNGALSVCNSAINTASWCTSNFAGALSKCSKALNQVNKAPSGIPGLSGVKNEANKLKGQIDGYKRTVNGWTSSLATHKSNLNKALGELSFPKMSSVSFTVGLTGISVAFKLSNGKTYTMSFNARRDSRDRRAITSCRNMGTEIYNFFVSKLAPVYNSIKNGVNSAVTSIKNGLSPVVSTINRISSLFSGDIVYTRGCRCKDRDQDYTAGTCTEMSLATTTPSCSSPDSDCTCVEAACTCAKGPGWHCESKVWGKCVLGWPTCPGGWAHVGAFCTRAYTRSCNCPSGYNKVLFVCEKWSADVNFNTQCDAAKSGYSCASGPLEETCWLSL